MSRRLIALLLLALTAAVRAAPSAAGPDPVTMKKIQQAFPGWKLNSSGRCAVSRRDHLWAWKLVLEREIAPNIKSSAARSGKGYVVIVMVPDKGVAPGPDFISALDWSYPGSDLKQFTIYQGYGGGCYWYMQSDISRLEYFRRIMGLTGGEDMDSLMADALNVLDFDLFTSRVAVEYFRGKGPKPVPLIIRAMKNWKQEEKQPPLQHLIALKLTGSTAGAEELMKIAMSDDHVLARQAIRLLVNEPWLAPESFYRRALPVPEYTNDVIRIFRTRKKLAEIEPRLRKLLKAPRTFRQYSDVYSALYELDHPGQSPEIPEYTLCNDIMLLMIRMGDTPDTLTYVPIEGEGSGTPAKMAAEERRRIEPMLEQLRKSKNHEAMFIAALAMSAYMPPAKTISPQYSARVRRVGLEIIRMLPPDFVLAHFDMLAKSLTDPAEVSLLRQIRREFGGR
ncbi:MAG: hypothetical protein IJS14_13620 [Lentisphaeria bacterium]|nr:hypothetical protein [Lentisphaeria bacterium]